MNKDHDTNTTKRSGFASPESERAWMEEIDRREQRLADGLEELIPYEDVLSDIREKYELSEDLLGYPDL